MRHKLFRTAMFTILLYFALAIPASAAPPPTKLMSIATSGGSGNKMSGRGASGCNDGQIVVFGSDATDLVGNDKNRKTDVFLRDTSANTTSLLSVGLQGKQGNGNSAYPLITPDCRYVAFQSTASNFIKGDSGTQDVFVLDRNSNSIERVSQSSAGGTTGNQKGNKASYIHSISTDGRYVVFVSDATNLVSGDTNRKKDVFLRDRQTGITTRVSLSDVGAQANDNSYWGDVSVYGGYIYVSFASNASNLVTGDGNGKMDVFVRQIRADNLAGVGTVRASVTSDGAEAEDDSGGNSIEVIPSGIFVAFDSMAANLVRDDNNNAPDVFVRRITESAGTTVTKRISVGDIKDPSTEGDHGSWQPDLAFYNNILYVSFTSAATNLVAGDTNGYDDILLYDDSSQTLSRLSITASGNQASGGHAAYSLLVPYPDPGQPPHITFLSEAGNLVAGDTNATYDAFLH